LLPTFIGGGFSHININISTVYCPFFTIFNYIFYNKSCTIMNDKIGLEQALAELVYSIALADGVLEDKEMEAFEEMITKELENQATEIKNKFLLLKGRSAPNVESAYKQAMYAIKQNKEAFSDELKGKYFLIIQKIAKSVKGLRLEERKLLDRFKTDIEYF